jgi:hypothetical protein
MASSDSHYDHPGAYDNGLIAAYAKDLSRFALWEAFRNRRIYGVTGDRIALDFSVNGQPMGSSFRCADTRVIHVSVLAWDKVDRVDIIKNNSLLHSFVEPVGLSRQARGRTRIRFKVEWGWDSQADRDWDGSLKIMGGRILQAIPCFRRNVASRIGRGVISLSDSECRWKSLVEKARHLIHFSRLADGVDFEVECAEEARLQFGFACAGVTRELVVSPADILKKPMVTYMETIPPTNDGAYWHGMKTYAKFKIHQGWLTDQLTLNLTLEDKPSAGSGQTDFYYVRLIQRNGQRAWSSPIWVDM